MSPRAFLCTAILAGIPLSAAAEAPAFFAISVSDLDASVRWYEEMLDLEPTRLPGTDQVQVALLQGEAVVVELIQHSEAVPPEAQSLEAGKRYLVYGLLKAGAPGSEATRSRTRSSGPDRSFCWTTRAT